MADSTAASRIGKRSVKHQRIRLACLRCQRRKIKCDGCVPKCRPCLRADAECIDGRKSQPEGSISRSEAASLHNYIRTLEATISQKVPSLDLATLRLSGDGSITSLLNDGLLSHTQHPHNDLSLVENDGLEANIRNTDNGHLLSTPKDQTPPTSPTHQHQHQREEVAHDIGLVPLSAGISKYVGPSSGFSLTKLILNRAKTGENTQITFPFASSAVSESPSTTLSRSVLAVQPGSLPVSIQQAIHLSRVYFEHVHVQYPILHEITFFDLLTTTYNNLDAVPKWTRFQVTMVLAISASILAKRVPLSFSGESLCALAMCDLESIDVQSSLEGLQCLILVYLFTLHNTYLGIDPWYLNYQFLATALDFGLQRDVPVSDTVTSFEKEMRTRIFWVIYTIDRTLATTLGRPIGVRDEGCDLRPIVGVEDQNLLNPALTTMSGERVSPTIREGPMMCAKTLFRLAQRNSEIKYVLHSVNKNAPAYTYPQIPSIAIWQDDMWQRLQNDHTEAPKFTDQRRYLTVLCSIRYNEVAMHLFRPTPHIRNPTTDSLMQCHKSAQETICLWKELYEADKMSYSWVTIHSVCLSALTMLYCIWTCHDIAASTQIETFTTKMRDASMLLSAAGEYWTEARKSRNRLDTLSSATVRWLLNKIRDQNAPSRQTSRQRNSRRSGPTSATPTFADRPYTRQAMQPSISDAGPECFDVFIEQMQDDPHPQGQPTHSQVDLYNDFDMYINTQDLASFLGAPGFLDSDSSMLMNGLFTDYQPRFEFGNSDMNGT